MKRSVISVPKMDCPTEEALIRGRLGRTRGVDGLEFDLMRRRVTVSHSLDDEKAILAALESIGMEPRSLTLAERGGAEAEHARRPVAPRAELALLALSGAAAVAAEAVSLWTGRETSALVGVLAAVSVAAGGRGTLRKGLAALRNLTLNINFLMTLAVAGALAVGEWAEAAMVVFLFGLAETIEGWSLDRARNAVRALMQMSPETATVRDDAGTWTEVAADAVRIGQTMRVRPGERIALDGVVAAGRSGVNQAPITGESMPVEKGEGDAVFAGTVNERGSLEVRVTAGKGDTTLARIVRTVQEAQSERAPTQRFVDRFARYYTPAVVTLAALVAAVPPLAAGGEFLPWLYRALVLLVIACPCALVISTPVTVVSGLTAAARRGILVKGGAYLEQGRRLRVVALDKTGTLTEGKPVVTDAVTLTGEPEERALRIAASIDAHSEHPVASAIVARYTGADRGAPGSEGPERRAAGRRAAELLTVEDFQSITGRGVRGRVGGTLYFVGNHRLAEENGVCTPALEAALAGLERQGKTTVVLTTEREALAVIAVADRVRPTSVEAVRDLHGLGLRTVVLTGDNAVTARAIARAVGIDEVRAGLLPGDKLSAIEGLLREHGDGGVGMVGDGINDAPALARASVGFAMGAAGTDTALETADVALMNDDLRRLPEFVRLSRRTGAVLAQNIALSIGIKVVFFGLAVAGAATLWMAVVADLGASLLVVANGLRLLRASPGQGPVR